MAVHSRRWSVSFRSLAGVACVVYVHDAGANNTVTALTGAGEPFYYSEDEDTDVLKVVRYKTGYLSLIETSYGELDDLYPATPTARFVEFYYGSRLDFVGYLQMQTFDTPWIDGRREVRIPVMSPLALTESFSFNYTAPQYRTLGNILYELIQKIEYSYAKIIFPDITGALTDKINSLVICPFNDNFTQKYDTGLSDLMAPISLYDYIEGLCNAYGWMVHEEGENLIFSQIDYDGDYAYYTFNNLNVPVSKADAEVIGSDEVDVEDYFQLADDDGKHSYILPMEKVTIKYEGDFVEKADMDLSHTAYSGESIQNESTAPWGSHAGAAWLSPIITSEYSSTYFLNTNTISDSDGQPTQTGVIIANAGEVGQFDRQNTQNEYAEPKERVLIKANSTWDVGDVIFSTKIYNVPFGFIQLEMQMSWGESVATLGNSLVHIAPLKFDVTISNSSQSVTRTITIQPNGTGKLSTLGQSGPQFNTPDTATITIKVNSETGIILAYVYSIDKITISTLKTALFGQEYVFFTDYKEKQTSSDTIMGGTIRSYLYGDVNMLFSPYRRNSNMLGTTLKDLPANLYSYLFTQQQTLQVVFRLTDFPTKILYTNKFTYWGRTWRILSYSFSPYDDEVTLVLYHSPILEA